jgi:hypothetical protein
LRRDEYTPGRYSLTSLRVGEEAFAEKWKSAVHAHLEGRQRRSELFVGTRGVALPLLQNGFADVVAEFSF